MQGAAGPVSAAPLLLAAPAAAGQSLAAVADEPEPEPEPEDDAESIAAFLVVHNLAKYAAAVVDEGYATVSDLLTADADELTELAQTLKLKKPEVRRFSKAGTCLSPRRYREYHSRPPLRCSVVFSPSQGGHFGPNTRGCCLVRSG